MKVDKDKLKAASQVIKNLISSNASFDKNRDKCADMELSQKARDNARNKMETEAEYIENQLHELHCLAVELGIADLDNSRYGEKVISSSNGWATNKIHRREPGGSSAMPEGFRIYVCTDCNEVNVKKDNRKVRVGFCDACDHPLWNSAEDVPND